jgi:hypothetical protein
MDKDKKKPVKDAGKGSRNRSAGSKFWNSSYWDKKPKKK